MTDAADRAARIVTFLADRELFAAIDAAAADRLLSPAEVARLYLAAAFLPAAQDQPA